MCVCLQVDLTPSSSEQNPNMRASWKYQKFDNVPKVRTVLYKLNHTFSWIQCNRLVEQVLEGREPTRVYGCSQVVNAAPVSDSPVLLRVAL